jgi:hypothetical protein
MKPTKWPGNWKVACQSCGVWYASSEIRKRWDGLLVCPKDYETKHPQLLIKIRGETAVPTFVNKDASPDVFATYCDINGNSAFADMGTADCMQADKVFPSYQALLDTLTNGQLAKGFGATTLADISSWAEADYISGDYAS